MKLRLVKLLVISCCFLLSIMAVKAQNCIPTNINGASINLTCNQTCSTLVFQIPHIKGTDNYAVNFVPYNAYPYTNATGVPLTTTYVDDKFSPLINLPFPFCFYGATYNSMVVGSNGVVTFDPICANQSNAYTLTVGGAPQPLPYNGGAAPGGISTTYYPRASIMGAYHDIDPSASPLPTRRIEYNVVGTAPCRKLVISYLDIKMFSCTSLICTQQIVLHESTGLVEVFIFNKPLCATWPSGAGAGLAILGMQDWTRTKYVAPPGKNCTQWSESNTGYLFTPTGGGSRFVSSQIYDLSGNPISAIADTATTMQGLLDLSFINFCPPPGSGQYVVKTIFSQCDNPASQIISLDTITITRPNLAMTSAFTGNTCVGANNGTISLTPTSGVAPFIYSLNGAPGISMPGAYTYNNLPPGVYTVTVTDVNNCVYTFTATLTAGPAMTTLVNKTDVLCNSARTGVITVTPPTVGTPPYQYSLDGTTWQSSNIFNGLAAGNYTVYYRSSDVCPGNTPITITEPNALTVSSVNTNASCDGGTDGTITVSAAGGAPGYQYSLDGNTWQSSNIFNVLPGTYTVSVKDNNGCITTYQTVVDLTNNLTATPQQDAIICEGKNTQLSINSNATVYSWTPSTGLSTTSVYNPVANPAVTTQYIVTATLGLCSIKDTVMVNVYSAPIPDAGPTGYICYGQTYQLQASGGTQYQWTPVTFLSNPGSASPVASPTKDIIYTLSILSDINGCASLVTDTVSIDVTPPIKVRTYPYDSVAYQGNTFQLLAVPNDSDVIKYVWSPAFGLSDPNIKNPVVTAGAIGDVALYKVTTSTIAGCAGEGFVTIRVYKGPDVYMPTGFTPNGDGRNDRFTPFPVGMKSYNYFRVYNRWGQLVFSTKQLHDGWDGKLGGRDQPTGVYVWMIEGTTNQDKIITKKGTVTLIRN